MFMRRFIQLQLGLLLYGASLALMVRADLGLNPWSVLHQGLSQLTGLSLGMVVNLVGALVLLIWIPLRQKPGVGTICNVLVIGTAADVALLALPPIEGLALRIVFLTAAIVLNGAATAAYIGAGLGPGPRDGLTTGLVRISGWRIGWARTAIEVAVLAIGWLLGGVAGVGTVFYALANGPLVQWFMARFEIGPKAEPATAPSV
ncbi:hypothetical protein D3C85_578300 [compost metagenome]